MLRGLCPGGGTGHPEIAAVTRLGTPAAFTLACVIPPVAQMHLYSNSYTKNTHFPWKKYTTRNTFCTILSQKRKILLPNTEVPSPMSELVHPGELSCSAVSRQREKCPQAKCLSKGLWSSNPRPSHCSSRHLKVQEFVGARQGAQGVRWSEDVLNEEVRGKGSLAN